MDVAMDEHTVTVTRADHPKARVRLCDLPAGGDYFQRVWLPVAGPSVVTLVSRTQDLTERAGGQVDITVKDLAKALGIPGRSTKGRTPSDPTVFHKNSVLLKTLSRTELMGFGKIDVGARSLTFAVYNRVAPLPARHVGRLPEFLRQDHWDAMAPVAARLAEHGLDLAAMTDVGPSGHRPPVGAAHGAVARLEQLRNPSSGITAPTTSPAVSL